MERSIELTTFSQFCFLSLMETLMRSLSFRSLTLSFIVMAGLSAVAPLSAQAGEKVTFRHLSTNGGIEAFELANELGYFEGTDVRLESLGYSQGGPQSLFGVASGSIDVGSAATPAVLNAIASGNDFVGVFPGNGINETTRGTFYVLEDSPITSVNDIAGKTIAVNTLGAHLDYVVREALYKQGKQQNEVQLVTVPGPQLEQTLRSKQVDIAAVGHWQATFDGQLRKNGGVRAIFTDTDILGEIAGGFVVLKRDFINAHPDAVRVFVEQSGRAADWARENPEDAKAKLAEVLERRGENKEIAQFWAGFGLRPAATPTARDVDFWIEVLEREGALPKGKYQAESILYKRDSSTQ